MLWARAYISYGWATTPVMRAAQAYVAIDNQEHLDPEAFSKFLQHDVHKVRLMYLPNPLALDLLSCPNSAAWGGKGGHIPRLLWSLCCHTSRVHK